MPDLEHARRRMVDAHLVARGIADARVLDAMRKVRRERFVAPGFEEFAYEDSPLPIGQGQTISQPFIVARMIEAATIGPGDRVLEVGTGSGYAAAVISSMAAEVFTVERHARLANEARARLVMLGFANIEVRIGDGSKGWLEKAPFDAILVAAGGPEIPLSLRKQLEIGGRLIIPVVGQETQQRLVRVRRISAAGFEEEDLGAVSFVPLIGDEGWSDETARVASAGARHTLPGRIEGESAERPRPNNAAVDAPARTEIGGWHQKTPPLAIASRMRTSYSLGMRKMLDAIMWLFIFPGDLVADRLGVSKEENRGLIRMLINGLLWIVVVIIGLAIWTSGLPIYQ